MEKVILESPYKGQMTQDEAELERFVSLNSMFKYLIPADGANKKYARSCLKDSLQRGESPLAPHLLYTQVLDDENYGERVEGISAGLNWYGGADACVVYIDRGISQGMEYGIMTAMELKLPIEFRSLDPDFKVLEKRYEYG